MFSLHLFGMLTIIFIRRLIRIHFRILKRTEYLGLLYAGRRYRNLFLTNVDAKDEIMFLNTFFSRDSFLNCVYR